MWGLPSLLTLHVLIPLLESSRISDLPTWDPYNISLDQARDPLYSNATMATWPRVLSFTTPPRRLPSERILESPLFLMSFFSFLKNFYCYSITVVCIFSPSLHPTPAEPTSLPHLHPPPWFCLCVLYSSSCKPLSPLSPPHSPLATVTLFLISMSLVIFCLFFSFLIF